MPAKVPGQDPGYDAQVKEAYQVRLFMDGPGWSWLQEHLSKARTRLIAATGRIDLSAGARAVICGKLALVEELLTRPEKLAQILHDAATPIRAEDVKSRPPRSRAKLGKL